MTRSRSLRDWLAIGALAAITATGCGKEGRPRPPESELPDLVKDLTATATRGAVELRWSIPQKNQDGSKPADVVGFQVLHSLLPVGADVPVLASKPELAFVMPVPTDAAGVPLQEAVLRDASAVAGTVNVYRVVTYGSTGYGTIPSNAVSIAWAVPPAPPAALTAQGRERAATLSWSAPTSRSDGTTETRPLAYRVYRWAAESEPTLLTETPVVETTFTDSSAPVDRTQNYLVRSVVRHTDVWIESDDSATVSIVSEDTTPPATPTGLVGARTPAGIELRWDPSPDPDVAGYHLYRLRPSGAGDRVTPNLIDGTRFLDARPPLGDVRYRVTAVDRSARANESPPSATITVR